MVVTFIPHLLPIEQRDAAMMTKQDLSPISFPKSPLYPNHSVITATVCICHAHGWPVISPSTMGDFVILPILDYTWLP